MTMQLTATCSAAVGFNGIVKALLTVTPQPNSPDEHILCNLLRSRGAIVEGRTYRITIEEENITAISP
jgi:hypothetical protein